MYIDYVRVVNSIRQQVRQASRSMKNQQSQEGEWEKKDERRKKIQEKSIFKEEKNEPTISHSLKKEFKKKKQDLDEEEWEEWDRFYNR